MKYYDKNGIEIQAGMHIVMEGGAVEKVYACRQGGIDTDLGINASNEKWLERHGLSVDINRELYPLSQFDLNVVEIQMPRLEQQGMLSLSI